MPEVYRSARTIRWPLVSEPGRCFGTSGPTAGQGCLPSRAEQVLLLPFDLNTFLETVGYVGLFAIVFAESGPLVGFFLPGDSLLFTAGFLASQGFFSLPVLAIGCSVAAILGDSFGYWFGKRVGRRLYEREDSRFFKKEHLRKAEEFYQRHGGKALILARLLCPLYAPSCRSSPASRRWSIGDS